MYDMTRGDMGEVQGSNKHTAVPNLGPGVARFGGHAPHTLSSLSPAQPVIADEEIICWGTFLKFFMYILYQVHAGT